MSFLPIIKINMPLMYNTFLPSLVSKDVKY